MRLINTILLVLILIAASAGAAFFYFGQYRPAQQAASAATPESPAPPSPIFLALEPFTVTLNDERGSQILYVEITLRTPDMDSRTRLVEYMPEVRNRVLGELSRYTPARVQAPDGRAELARALRTVLSAPYEPQPDGPHISNVLFTAFVVQ